MKKIMSLILSASVFLSSTAFAECKWATGVTKVEQGYLYTPECHARVGTTVKDLEDRETEVAALRKTIELKDLVITKADERTVLWRNESYEQYDRLMKQQELSRKNETLWFVLGIVVTGAAVWGAGQLR
jgi:hypothetical protein